MSFSFSFSGDDIEDEFEPDVEEHEVLANNLSEVSISESKLNTHVHPPKNHSFEELLASLPSQISYNALHIPPSPTTSASSTTTNIDKIASNERPLNTSDAVKVYRRSLFDIRTQLMAEVDPSAAEAETDSAGRLLEGLENGDLSSGVYEGGFKTWECALDLASLLVGDLNPFANASALDQDWDIIELGAGSAIPSLAFLQNYLLAKRQMPGEKETAQTRQGTLSVTLCDYNEDVLRLATAPNVFLNHHFSTVKPSSPSSSSSAIKQDGQGEEDEGDLDLEDVLEESSATPVPATMTALHTSNISLTFISGGWGPDFLNLLTPSSNPPGNPQRQRTTLILASETIYSPSSIKPFSQLLISILHSRSPNAKAYIAAKKVYFGVGGGVDEFEREMQALGGRCRVVYETRDTGVGRVVLEVTAGDVLQP